MNEYNYESGIEINTEELLTKLPADLEVAIQGAERCMHMLPPAQETLLSRWCVRKLGMRRAKNGAYGHEENAAAELAARFCAAGEAFSLGFRSHRSGSSSFLIGTREKTDALARGLLRGAFGIADLEKAQDQQYNYQSACICTQVCLDEDGIEKAYREKPEPARWMDSMAQAVTGMECEAQLVFSPLDGAWLDAAIQRAVELMNLLSRYQENSIQISSSGSFNFNENDWFFGKIGKFISGEKKKSSGGNSSFSANMKQEHWQVSTVYNRLKHSIRLWQQMRRDGGWRVEAYVQANDKSGLKIIQGILGGTFTNAGYRCSWENFDEKTCMILPGVRLAEVAGCPSRSFPGLEMEEIRSLETNLPQPAEGSKYVQMGKLVWNDQEMPVEMKIPLDDLNRHAFICGMTGSGKSNTVCSLLEALKGIPFMVIEPVKGEYRSLRKVIPGLKVYTMEAGGEGHLRMNPFWFPREGRLQYHIDSLKAIISAAFDLYAAMPNILEQCLTSAYVKKGWNISTSRNIFEDKLPEEMLYPTFNTLCNEVELYLEKAKFGEELKGNYKGALLSRLQSFTTGAKGLLLNRPVRPCIQDWIRNGESIVIELDELADDSDKAIVMGTIMAQYFQCIKYGNAHIEPRLRHVIVLEEAHHLFKDSAASGGQEGGGNSRQQLVETLNNMLAEIRAYGEGVFIVDQSPTGISPQVIKNTAVKMVHRTDYADDLQILRNALLLDEEDITAPAALERGHCLVRYGTMKRPVHAHMPLCKDKENDGLRKDRAAEAANVQNVLDLIQTNESVRLKLMLECGKFINHLLFDSMEKAFLALGMLIEYIRTEVVSFGYNREIMESITDADMEYVLRNLVADSLARKYPDQYLLCGQLQMAVERFIELQLRDKDRPITGAEMKLVAAYLANEIIPALAFYYSNSTEPGTRQIADRIADSRSMSQVGVIRGMLEIWNGLTDERRVQVSEMQNIPAEKLDSIVYALASGDFLLEPCQYSSKLLWRAFRGYLKSLKNV